jgi:hypothetical protein
MHALCSSHTLCWPSSLLRDSPVARVFHAIGPPKGAVTLHGRDISLNPQTPNPILTAHPRQGTARDRRTHGPSDDVDRSITGITLWLIVCIAMEARDFSPPIHVGILCLQLGHLSSHSGIIILFFTYPLAVRDILTGPS